MRRPHSLAAIRAASSGVSVWVMPTSTSRPGSSITTATWRATVTLAPADPLHHCAHNTAGYPERPGRDALATIPVTGGDAVVGEIRAVGWRAAGATRPGRAVARPQQAPPGARIRTRWSTGWWAACGRRSRRRSPSGRTGGGDLHGVAGPAPCRSPPPVRPEGDRRPRDHCRRARSGRPACPDPRAWRRLCAGTSAAGSCCSRAPSCARISPTTASAGDRDGGQGVRPGRARSPAVLCAQWCRGSPGERDGAAHHIAGAIDEPACWCWSASPIPTPPSWPRGGPPELWGLHILDGEKSCSDVDAPLLVISQFTLYAELARGRRPSWSAAAPGPVAEPWSARGPGPARARGRRG